jgi:predicted dehydrogenase
MKPYGNLQKFTLPNLVIVGSGFAGQAIRSAYSLLANQDFNQTPSVTFWERGRPLREAAQAFPNSILVVANPHGLHAQTLLEADSLGFHAILVEKPACTHLADVQTLRGIKTPTAVLHVYRQMWGLQTLKEMLTTKELGDLFAIEGRYWQSSAAERAWLAKNSDPAQAPASAKSWKSDSALSGGSDVYLDLATHLMDSVTFLMGSAPTQMRTWKSYVASDASHRDNHVQISADFAGGRRAQLSASKIVHGSSNHFEINVLGSLGSATWTFENPDQIVLGRGRTTQTLVRKATSLGSGMPPYHGLGWLEGYIEIMRQVLIRISSDSKTPVTFPDLKSNLDVIEAMLKATET